MMSENDAPGNGDEGMSEDEKLAAEWESAMADSGDAEGGVA